MEQPDVASAPILCQYCGGATQPDIVKVALWNEERLVVVEDVPARVCSECFEQYYDDSIRFYLDKLTGLRFPADMVRRTMEVPVFSLDDIKKRR